MRAFRLGIPAAVLAAAAIAGAAAAHDDARTASAGTATDATATNGAASPTSSIALGTSTGFSGYSDVSVVAPLVSATQSNLDFACYHDLLGQSPPYLEGSS